jgi:hypothetical protein
MISRLLIRLIEQASDPLASAIYQRILDDRRAVKGQATLNSIAMAWTQIVAWAVSERILQANEADEFLIEMRDEDAAAASFGARSAKRRCLPGRVRARGSPYRRLAGPRHL